MIGFFYWQKIQLKHEEYKLIVDPAVKKCFLHKELPDFIKKTITELSIKNNHPTIPVKIYEDKSDDGAYCSFYTEGTYQIEIPTFFFLNIGAIPGKPLSNKSKKLIKAAIAHEYGHFYYNDSFHLEFIVLDQLYAMCLLTMHLHFYLLPVPVILYSVYSKCTEFREDLFVWRNFPKEYLKELTNSAENEKYYNMKIITHLRLFFIGSHPSSQNRLKFIKGMQKRNQNKPQGKRSFLNPFHQ